MEAGESARRRLERLGNQEAELEEKLQRVRREKQAWAAGEEGERVVAAALTELPAGWRVLHDRRKRIGSPANIDHIAIGPTGVHVIDAKNWSGALEISAAGVRCGSWPRNRETATVAELRDLVATELAAAGLPAPVFGVVSLANEANTLQTVVHEGIAFVPASGLAQGLTTLPDALSAEHVYRIWEFLDDNHPPRTTPSVGLPSGPPRRGGASTSPGRRRHVRPSPPQRRVKSGFGSPAARVAVVAAAVFIGLSVLPAVLQHASKSVSQSIAASFPTPSAKPTQSAAPVAMKRACSVMSAARASKLLGRSVHARSTHAGVMCEFRVVGVARPAAVVALGPAVSVAAWQSATLSTYGSYCGKYALRPDGGVNAACVDTIGTGVANARAFAFDDAWIAAAERL